MVTPRAVATAAKGIEHGQKSGRGGLLNFVVVAAVGAVAYTDWVIVADVSLAYLYVLPIALCALVDPLPFTIALGAVCAFLGDIFGPPAPSLLWRVVHNVVYLASFLIVGFLVTLIAKQRDSLAEKIRHQRDEYETRSCAGRASAASSTAEAAGVAGNRYRGRDEDGASSRRGLLRLLPCFG